MGFHIITQKRKTYGLEKFQYDEHGKISFPSHVDYYRFSEIVKDKIEGIIPSDIWLFSFFLVLFVACSSSQETSSSSEQEVSGEKEIYVFDDVAATDTSMVADDTEKVETEISLPEKVSASSFKYIVQVGAFSTRDRAEKFIEQYQSKLDQPMIISFSGIVNLFVIQLHPFNSRTEAESVRNRLWQTKDFKDAFIITVKE